MAKSACIGLYCLVLYLSGCASAQASDPAQTQQLAQAAWSQPRVATWELRWPEMPVPGPIIFVEWQSEASQKQRLEILETRVPALVGLVYINDGQQAWHFNRLEPASFVSSGDQSLPFSPISDAFDSITSLLAETPAAASQRSIPTRYGPGVEFVLHYPQSRTLKLHLDLIHNLIIVAHLESADSNLSLISREIELLPEPHPDLFKPLVTP